MEGTLGAQRRTPPDMKKHKLSDRQFGLMMTVVLLVIAGGNWFLFEVFLTWALIAACVVGLVAIFLPGALLPFTRFWMFLADKLGRVANFVLLSLFFYLFIMPFGLIIRLSGRDSMHRRPNRNAKTYWTPVNRHTDETTLHDMF